MFVPKPLGEILESLDLLPVAPHGLLARLRLPLASMG